jgi:hypothetical protein
MAVKSFTGLTLQAIVTLHMIIFYSKNEILRGNLKQKWRYIFDYLRNIT